MMEQLLAFLLENFWWLLIIVSCIISTEYRHLGILLCAMMIYEKPSSIFVFCMVLISIVFSMWAKGKTISLEQRRITAQYQKELQEMFRINKDDVE